MKVNNTSIKDGTVDYIFDECAFKRELTDSLLKLYKQWGYSEIMTPVIEYKNVFCGNEVGDVIKEEDIFTFSDEKNIRLAIRPDCTLPIARIASTKLNDVPAPYRLCYSQNIVRAHSDLLEMTQSGIELIGDNSIISDLEVLLLASKALMSFDKNFRIEIGYATLLNLLIKEYNVGKDVAEEIFDHIEKKNFASLEQLDIPDPIKKLPRYFGGPDVLDKYKQLCDSEPVNRIINYLNDIYIELCKCGFEDHISFDLGIVNPFEYYTGIIFRGYISESGSSVLSGGRYDNLLEKFGNAYPAIGFGINIDTVFLALKKNIKKSPSPEYLVCALGSISESLAFINQINDSGKSAVISFSSDIDQVKKEAKQKDIGKIVFIKDGKVEVISNE